MALVGLSAIAGFQTNVNDQPQATPEQRYGGIADPRHANVGEVAQPYPWMSNMGQAGSHGPYGPENQLLWDFDEWALTPAGDMADDPTFDRTPSRRAAPMPKGILSGPIDAFSPDAVADMRAQSAAIHGIRMGAGLKALTGLPATQDEWVEVWEVQPGTSNLQPLPRQAMSSGFMWGTRSREQSMARQNEYGFDSNHHHRRYAEGPIPGNTMWMRPGGRPMRKTLAGPARPPIGKGSPFEGQDLGFNWDPTGAVLQTVPGEYVAPPTPQLQTAPVSADYGDSVIEWY